VRVSEVPAPVKAPLAPLLERLRASVMLRQAALVFASTMMLNLCGFVFHAIASRRLGVEVYGEIVALLAVVTIVILPISLVAPTIGRFAAEFRALHDDEHMCGMTRDLAWIFGLAGALCVLSSMAAAGPVSAYLHVPWWSVPAAGALGALAMANAGFRALAQGMQSFGTFAVSVTTEGVVRVAAVVALLYAGLALAGGVGAFFIGSLAGLLALARIFGKLYAGVRPRRIRYDWRRIVQSSAGAATAAIAVTLIGTVDVVIVKHYFGAADAGLYSAASQGGKIMLYFVGFIPVVLLPQVTDRYVRGERTRQTLAAAVGLLAVIAVCCVLGVKLFGLVLLNVLFGHAFDAAYPLLVGYSIAMVLLASINLLASYGIATHRLAFAAPLVAGTAATLVAIGLLHHTLDQVVNVLIAGMAGTCAAVAAALIWQGLRPPPRPAAPEV
jgi:O-antigen/teichoic acid export membrane protein